MHNPCTRHARVSARNAAAEWIRRPRGSETGEDVPALDLQARGIERKRAAVENADADIDRQHAAPRTRTRAVSLPLTSASTVVGEIDDGMSSRPRPSGSGSGLEWSALTCRAHRLPAFQFDDDGQPWPLVQPVLRALPAYRSAWQRAFWLVSPNEWLDERVPADALHEGDERVVEAAGHAGAVVIG